MVGNRDLHPAIARSRDPRTLNCQINSTEIIHCTGNITVQDLIPRNFSFLFGFKCDIIHSNSSLRGLVYNVSIYGTNETKCLQLASDNTCYHYLPFNLINALDFNRNIFSFNFYHFWFGFRYHSNCYQHLHEYLCYMFFPRCDPVSKQAIHPCREMCQDAKDTPCNHYGDYEYINCNYLPSVRALWGDNPCFYEPVFCSTPPIVENATHNGYRYVHSSLHEKVEYSCDEGFEMEGNKIVTCNYNGRWSAPPRCSPKIIVNSTLSPTIESGIGSRPGRSRSSLHDLLSIVLPLLLILLAITLVVLVVRYQRKIRTRRKHDLTMEYVQFEIALIQRNAIDEPPLPLRRKHDSLGTAYSVSTPKRIRPFDATIFYHFDTDDDFVLNQLLPELEESRDFNLCIHSRNPVPGRDIKDNIEEAIEGSNSAIIVMSQGFVDSM